MPTYEPLFKRYPETDDLPIPDIGAYRFRSPADVVEFARHDATIGWATWPDVWHLDADGRFHCYFKASSCDGIRRWADDPYGLLRSRRDGLRSPDGCAPNWLIVENRTLAWRKDVPPSELDVQAFLAVRAEMASIGVNLVDAMIFDDDCHWWSMHDLERPGQPYALRDEDRPARSRRLRRVDT
jgi:hypothetical protein